MADEVLPGVLWLRGTRGSNVYLVRGGNGAFALVDTGFASSVGPIIDEVRRLCDPDSVTHVLLTHAHFDHSAAAPELARKLGAQVVAGRGDCVVDSGGALRLDDRYGRVSLRGRRVLRTMLRLPSAGERVLVDVPLEGEVELMPGLRAIPVPGHTPGTYCYVAERPGVAFTGDLFISHKDGLARTLAATNADDKLYLATLREFALRAPEAACPGHGRPILSGFRAALEELASGQREPLRLSNLPRRVRRLIAFAGFILRRR